MLTENGDEYILSSSVKIDLNPKVELPVSFSPVGYE